MQTTSHGRAVQGLSSGLAGYVHKVRVHRPALLPLAPATAVHRSLRYIRSMHLQGPVSSHAGRLHQHSQHSSVVHAAAPANLPAQQQQQRVAWAPAARPAGRRVSRVISTSSTAEAISIGSWAITTQKGGQELGT